MSELHDMFLTTQMSPHANTRANALRMLALLCAFFVACVAFAQDQPFPYAEKIDATLRAEIKKQEVVGMAVLVIDQGKVAWSKAYGYADREQHIPVDLNHTQFRWASVSKPLTAIAAMQLVEKGQLDLDADVRSYVPEFPDKGVKITARELLCHRGGIVHNNGLVIESKAQYTTPHPFADVIVALDKFKESPLLHPPGQQFEYSTKGYMLLSAVVERAGKQRFADQIQDRIAKPLNMKTLRPDFPWEDIPGRIVGYLRNEKGVQRRQDSDVTEAYWKWGGGGYSSTPSDLAAFCVGLLQGKLVSKETQQQMWSPVTPTDKPKFNYGFGFYVVQSPWGTRWIGHDGMQTKARTGLLMEPENNRGVVIMTNCEWVDPMRIAITLLEIMK